jgi:hypothetical protein
LHLHFRGQHIKQLLRAAPIGTCRALAYVRAAKKLPLDQLDIRLANCSGSNIVAEDANKPETKTRVARVPVQPFNATDVGVKRRFVARIDAARGRGRRRLRRVPLC